MEAEEPLEARMARVEKELWRAAMWQAVPTLVGYIKAQARTRGINTPEARRRFFVRVAFRLLDDLLLRMLCGDTPAVNALLKLVRGADVVMGPTKPPQWAERLAKALEVQEVRVKCKGSPILTAEMVAVLVGRPGGLGDAPWEALLKCLDPPAGPAPGQPPALGQQAV